MGGKLVSSQKKKILFITSKMVIGGVERALINLLACMDSDRYDLTLLLLEDGGEWECLIPSNVKISRLSMDSCGYNDYLLEHRAYLRLAKTMLCRAMTHIFKEPSSNTYFAVRAWPVINEKYDCVVLFKIDSLIGLHLATQITSVKKIAWMHNSFLGIAYDSWSYRRSIGQMDGIVCVSSTLQDEFQKCFPGYKGRIDVIHNLLDVHAILDCADEPCDISLKGFSILTVGRLSIEKGQQMIPATMRLLLDAEYDVYWYLVGDGPGRAEIEEACKQYGVEDRVILLGAKQNPYVYVKNADIYVQTSLTEGWCLTIQEAKLLQKPIVSTPIPVIMEQIVSGENGEIAQDISPEALFVSIQILLDSPEKRNFYSEQLRNQLVNNDEQIKKLYAFIEA